MAQEGCERLIFIKALLITYVIVMALIFSKLICEVIRAEKTSEVLENEDLKKYAEKFVKYVGDTEGLIVKGCYSMRLGWRIQVLEEGYDRPFINVYDRDIKKAFDKAYAVLEERNVKEDEKF